VGEGGVVTGVDGERNPVLDRVRSELLRAARQAAPRRRRRHSFVVVLIGLVALAGASAASAITRAGPLAHMFKGAEVPIPVPRHPVANRPDGCAELKSVADGRAEPSVKRVDPGLRDMLGVFRRPQRPQEAVSNCGIELEDGENFTLGRIVVLPTGEIAFLWPARHAVCIGVAGLGACPGVQVLRRHGVAIGGGFNQGVPRGMMRVFGVARDDVHEIVFALPDGREVIAPITDNAFSLLLPIEKITAARVDDDGSRHLVPGVPDLTVLGADAP
jgi:hypothetical protein